MKIKKWNGLLKPSHYRKVVDSLRSESDRAAGILAASFVEHFLKDFLQEILVKDAVVDELFDSAHAPLSTFSSRAKVCFALRLISRELLGDLEIIRDIRNHFAHHPLETSFDNIDVERLCSQLSVAESLRKTQRYTSRKAFLSAASRVVDDLHLARAERRGICVTFVSSNNKTLQPTRTRRAWPHAAE